ncbi:Protein ABCI7, chloroplastic [Linum perenne]
MSVLASSPFVIRSPNTSISSSFAQSSSRPKFHTSVSLSAAPTVGIGFSDPFVLQLAETLEDSASSSPSPYIQSLRDSSSESLVSTPWPSRKDEAFRFTDTSFIRQSQILPISQPPEIGDLATMSEDTSSSQFLIVDGYLLNSSVLSTLPDGVFVGSLSGGEIAEKVSSLTSDFQWGDLFWSINGLGAPDVAVVYVPAGVRVETPVHFKYLSVEGAEGGSKVLPLSNPRVFVVVEEGGEIEIIEEFVSNEGNEDKSYWTNSVLEVVIGEGAKVKHSYVQNQSFNCAHIKWTSVKQESASSYELVEASSGGKLSRHNLHIQQLGPDTNTEVSTFHLSAGDQTQDLHSRLIFDHPRASSRQLHKCIVAHSSGQAVFDGNIRVNRYAQQTDAGQLTRSLLLEPRATVNIKPNLQIIADDVKCSHGAAISDLEDDQIFYMRARGVDLDTARKALVFSFGKEVINRLPHLYLQKGVEKQVKEVLGRL